jgi:hypothetical protein
VSADFDAAMRLGTAAAMNGEPIPRHIADVLLADLDELHRRDPGMLLKLLLIERPEPSRVRPYVMWRPTSR